MTLESIEPLLTPIRQLQPPGQPAYLVGGAVRDILINRPIHDLDLTMPSPIRPFALQLADKLGAAFYMLDPIRETARLVWTDPEGERIYIDIASLREASLEADLRARDFTVNAMALQVDQPDKLIDLQGGAADLRAKILRACSERSFSEDPVRILRAVRLSLELEMKIEPESYRLLRASAPELSRVSAERLRDEWFKMLDGPRVATGLRLAERSGILDVIAPDLLPLKGLPQSAPHVLDAWEHTLAVVQELEDLFTVLVGSFNEEASSNLVKGLAVLKLGMFRENLARHFSTRLNPDRTLRSLLFMAALYHDSGKTVTFKREPSGRTRFIDHEQVSAKLAADRGRALALSGAEVERLETVMRYHMYVHFLAKDGLHQQLKPRTIYRFFRTCGEAGVDVCLLSLADLLGTYRNSLPQAHWQAELDICQQLLDAWWNREEKVINPPRLVNGNDLKKIFHLENSPLIGKLLDTITEAQAAGEVHTPDEAIAYAARWLEAEKTPSSKE